MRTAASNEIADEEIQAVLDSYTGNYRSATDLATIPDMDHSIRGRWTLLRMVLLQEALLQRDEDHPLDETAQQAAQEEHLSNIEASSIVKVPFTKGCRLWTEVPDDWNVDIHDPISRKNCMNAITHKYAGILKGWGSGAWERHKGPIPDQLRARHRFHDSTEDTLTAVLTEGHFWVPDCMRPVDDDHWYDDDGQVRRRNSDTDDRLAQDLPPRYGEAAHAPPEYPRHSYTAQETKAERHLRLVAQYRLRIPEKTSSGESPYPAHNTHTPTTCNITDWPVKAITPGIAEGKDPGYHWRRRLWTVDLPTLIHCNRNWCTLKQLMCTFWKLQPATVKLDPRANTQQRRRLAREEELAVRNGGGRLLPQDRHADGRGPG